MATIDAEQLEKLCKLAKLKIEQSEQEQFLKQINSVFNWIDQLSKIDVSGVSLDDDMNETTYERHDEPEMTNTREEVLSNTKNKKFDMFSVPKIVE